MARKVRVKIELPVQFFRAFQGPKLYDCEYDRNVCKEQAYA